MRRPRVEVLDRDRHALVAVVHRPAEVDERPVDRFAVLRVNRLHRAAAGVGVHEVTARGVIRRRTLVVVGDRVLRIGRTGNRPDLIRGRPSCLRSVKNIPFKSYGVATAERKAVHASRNQIAFMEVIARLLHFERTNLSNTPNIITKDHHRVVPVFAGVVGGPGEAGEAVETVGERNRGLGGVVGDEGRTARRDAGGFADVVFAVAVRVDEPEEPVPAGDEVRPLAADEAVFDDREVIAVDHDGEFVRNADGDSVREDGSVLPDDAERAGAGGFVALGGDGGVAVLVVGVRDFDGHGGVGAHRVGDRRGGDLVALVRVDQTLGSGDDGRFGAVDDAGAVVDRAAVLEHAVRLAAEAGLARLGGVGLNDDVAGVGDGAGVVEREFEFRHRELTGVGRIRAGHVLLPVGPAVEIGILRRVVAIRVERDRTAHAHRALPGVRQTVAVVVELAVGETRGGIDLVVVGEARVARVGIGGIRSGLAFAPVVETVEVRVPGRTGEFVRHGAGLVLERDLVVVWIGRRGIVPRHAREAPQFVRERNLRINGIPRHQRRPLQRHARRLADIVLAICIEIQPAEEPIVSRYHVLVSTTTGLAHLVHGQGICPRCDGIRHDEIPVNGTTLRGKITPVV